jgi:hypothetical protein
MSDADRDPHAAQTLAWAAALHEIGISIAHNGYHKHSAYVIANADMPGFSRMEQSQLARLVLAHRGRPAKLQDLSPDPADWAPVFCLRLASLFCRSRTVSNCRNAGEMTESGFRLLLPQDAGEPPAERGGACRQKRTNGNRSVCDGTEGRESRSKLLSGSDGGRIRANRGSPPP